MYCNLFSFVPTRYPAPHSQELLALVASNLSLVCSHANIPAIECLFLVYVHLGSDPHSTLPRHRRPPVVGVLAPEKETVLCCSPRKAALEKCGMLEMCLGYSACQQ